MVCYSPHARGQPSVTPRTPTGCDVNNQPRNVRAQPQLIVKRVGKLSEQQIVTRYGYRANPLFNDVEEQEVAITIECLEEGDSEGSVKAGGSRCAPSTSSGYGSGRVSPAPVLQMVFQISPEADSPICTLSKSFKDDIKACIGKFRWDKEVEEVVSAASRGANGVRGARARLQAALLALAPPPAPLALTALPYRGPGVRPGDVTMIAKTTDISFLASLFCLILVPRFDRTCLYTYARCHDYIKVKQQASLARSRDSCLDLYVRFSIAVGRVWYEITTNTLFQGISCEPKRQTIHGLELHLSKFHGEENRQYLKRQAEKEEQKLEAKLKRRKSEISIATGSTNSSSGGQLVQITIFKTEQARALKASKWPDDHEISRRIDKSIMDLIIVDMLPYSIVDKSSNLKLLSKQKLQKLQKITESSDENGSEVMRSMKTKLHESMNRRFAYVQGHAALITSTLLDPRFKNTYLNSDEVDIATMEIENHMRIYADNSRETAGTSDQEPSSSYRLSPYEKDGGLWDFHDKSTSQAIQSSDASDKDDLSTQAKKNIEIYLAEPRLQRNADICSYWDCSPSVSLRKVALKYLSAPPTTVSSEQLFSAAGQIYSDRRSNLLGENVDKLLFLTYNIRLFRYEY
ncbi:Zinc finger BED domain-containing protein 4 [Eumeta japonica]|uniref:Zinc finger BED domain-containing protein 4 n=1 Tax=Eumeta variegata TaxID=151549 RepID=A0A4C1YBU5_EUMVA|nr:Zinc finger BED domain-containing protein 4 [Eumeta japonica]